MLQIIGTKSSKDTNKAVRYCKERRIDFQFVDIKERLLAPKEWESIFNAENAEKLIDTSSALYKKKYAYMEFDAQEEVMEHPELLTLPVLRNKGKAIIGFDEAFIKETTC